MSSDDQVELKLLLHHAQSARLDNRLNEALELLVRALNLDPQSIPILMELSLLYQQKEQWGKARECFELLLSVEPDNPQVLNALGNTWQAEGEYKKAIKHWKKAIAIAPDYAEVWQNIALAYEHLNDLPEAITTHQKVVSLLPENARAHRFLGMAQLDYGLLPAANQCFEKALMLAPEDPENRWQRFFIKALVGDFPDAWRDYECRFTLPSRTTPDHGFTINRWQGERFPNKTILLHAEQGYGDTLQMIRYIPRVAEHGGKIILWVPSPLASLMKTIHQIDQVVTKKPDPNTFDLQLPLMSLPGVFQDSLETIPNSVPYIPIQRMGQNSKIKKIGLCWSGSENQPLDRRSIKVSALKPLFNRSDLEFHSLQQKIPPPPGVLDHSTEMIDFKATAKIIEGLDCVISIDTSIAHLAGALGKPLWILLSFAPDWRWGVQVESSPWYPSAKLFRQNYGEPWSKVISRLSEEL